MEPEPDYEPGPFTLLFEPAGDGGCIMHLQVTGFPPGTTNQSVIPYYADTMQPLVGGSFVVFTDGDGNGVSAPWSYSIPQVNRLLVELGGDFFGTWTVACREDVSAPVIDAFLVVVVG